MATSAAAKSPAGGNVVPMFAILTITAVALLFLGSIALAVLHSLWWLIAVVIFAALLALAIYDVIQPRLAVLRIYPLLGHMRYLMEEIRPMIQQYFVERNWDGRPYDADARALIYERARGIHAEKSFGTELEVRDSGYEYLLHSVVPGKRPKGEHRVVIGGPQCSQPFDVSLLNIASMSFGALSVNAVRAMNRGAYKGGFFQESGEGGVTRYHLESGADIVWEFGSGYFGCRTPEGNFNPEMFAQRVVHPNIKGVLIKLSQGAKPGLGGVLPAEKITPEIVEARGVVPGKDCISPPSHTAFTTPTELMQFVGQLRELSNGKPIGFKLCVGLRTDVLAIVKAMLETGILPDFIVVDGSEGGTGAAPLEYEDHVGTPLTEGLILMHNALVGAGIRQHIKIGAAGKIVAGTDIIRRIAQGADYCLAARAMMMATGCIQAQRCHTNKCPTGVATQNPRLYRGLDMDDKAEQVYHYHKSTVAETAQMIATIGLDSPDQLRPAHIFRRVSQSRVESYAEAYDWLEPGELLGTPRRSWAEDWNHADPHRFGPPISAGFR